MPHILVPLLLVAIGLFSTSLQCLANTEKTEKRPNIFFFFADDWGKYASIYTESAPSRVFQTPAFDRIATEGVRFTNAHVNAPSCTPCRSALFSGQYFYRTDLGAFLHSPQWNSEIPTFPLLLESAGYHIGHTYKGWGPGAPVNAPLGGGRTAYVKRGGRFNSFSQNVTKMVAAGKPLQAAKDELYKECLDNFEDFLTQRPAGQPYCYYFGPTNTHRAWVQGSGKNLWNIDPQSLQGKMPPFLPDVPEIREDFADYLGETLALDAVLGLFLKRLEQTGELENTIIVVSGDHGIPGFPRGKTNLYDLGTNVSLFIRWGEQVPRNRRIDDFVNLMDIAPTLLDAAGLTPLECMTGKSLLPILRSDKSGQIDPSRDFVVTGRERHFITAREGNLPYPMRAIRTNDFLYIRNFCPDRTPMGDPKEIVGELSAKLLEAVNNNTGTGYAEVDSGPTKAWMAANKDDSRWSKEWQLGFGQRPAEELYDLKNDPFCLENVAAVSSYQELRKRQADRLMQVLTSTKDPRVTGDGTTFDNPPFVSR